MPYPAVLVCKIRRNHREEHVGRGHDLFSSEKHAANLPHIAQSIDLFETGKQTYTRMVRVLE
jgi:hypothetical protein